MFVVQLKILPDSSLWLHYDWSSDITNVKWRWLAVGLKIPVWQTLVIILTETKKIKLQGGINLIIRHEHWEQNKIMIGYWQGATGDAVSVTTAIETTVNKLWHGTVILVTPLV